MDRTPKGLPLTALVSDYPLAARVRRIVEDELPATIAIYAARGWGDTAYDTALGHLGGKYGLSPEQVGKLDDLYFDHLNRKAT